MPIGIGTTQQEHLFTAEEVEILQSLSTKKSKKNKFSLQEDEYICSQVELHKSQGLIYPNWSEIAKGMPGRNTRQIRERYQHYLDPTISKNPWSQEEDQMLVQLYQRYGPDWAKIAKSLPGRTNTGVKNRFNVHFKQQTNEHVQPAVPDFSSLPEIQAENTISWINHEESTITQPIEEDLFDFTPSEFSFLF